MAAPQAESPEDRAAAGKESRLSRPPIFTRPLLLIFVADFGALTSFFLLLSVVPLYVTSGGASRADAGLANGALTFATVAGELVTPRLVARFGYRAVFVAGLLLLGPPSVAMAASATMTVIISACIVRGLGFAMTVVAGSAMVALLIPAERRGEGLGLYGVGAGVPSVVALPLGVWLAGHVGYPPVFAAGAVAALIGLAALPVLPGREARPARPCPDTVPAPTGVLTGLRTAALVRPTIIFLITAMGTGAVVTFLPIALTRSSGSIAPLALLALLAAATLTRWQVGRYHPRNRRHIRASAARARRSEMPRGE